MTRRSAALLVLVCCLAPAPTPAPPGEPDGTLDRPARRDAPTLEPDTGRTTRASLGAEGLAYRIESKILGETRTINLALPRSFADTGPERRYPVAVVLDGEADLPAAAAVAAELAARGQIPEMVLVAIENTDRLRDLTPPGLSVSGSSRHEGGDRFLVLAAEQRGFRAAPAQDVETMVTGDLHYPGQERLGRVVTVVGAIRAYERFLGGILGALGGAKQLSA